MERVLPNQGKGRVAEHYARMSVNHEKYLFQVLGQPIHTLSHLRFKRRGLWPPRLPQTRS